MSPYRTSDSSHLGKEEKLSNEEFDKMLRGIRQSFEMVKNGCIGCEELIQEGPRAYTRLYPKDKDGFCTKCGKDRTYPPRKPRNR